MQGCRAPDVARSYDRYLGFACHADPPLFPFTCCSEGIFAPLPPSRYARISRTDPGMARRVVEVTQAIKTRRSVGRLREDPVSRELIKIILESAVHAPNHKITE